ncbi:MAG: TerB family tellurite resistance protein [Bdellovibrionales bacterium]|nr:TerB family tellurite resistance protein [Bdellovibrionales bacterium]
MPEKNLTGAIVHPETSSVLTPGAEINPTAVIVVIMIAAAIGVGTVLTLLRRKRQDVLLDDVFGMFAKLAKADGRVCEQEIAALNRYMVHTLKLDERARKRLSGIFKHAKDARRSFTDYAEEVGRTFRRQPEILVLVIHVLIDLAKADNLVVPDEEQLLIRAINEFGLRPERFLLMGTKTAGGTFAEKPPLREDFTLLHYELLESQPGDSLETIKKRYRKLVKRYHPDRLVSKGLSPELIAVAQQKFIEIKAAYEEILRQRK